MNGITALIKETPESYPRELPLRATPGPLPCEVLAKRWPPMNEEVGLHQTPNLQVSNLGHPSLWNHEK